MANCCVTNISLNQLQELLQHSDANQNVTISMGKLQIINNTTAECLHCHSKIDITSLTKAELEKATITGLCKNCQNILKQAAVISQSQNSSNNIPVVPTINQSSMSAGQQCRQYIFQAIPNMTQEHIKMFCDETLSKELFGILYPLFVKVTNCSPEEINQLRKPRGFNRYGIRKQRIGNDDYLICNDLYDRHIARFKNVFIDLGLISGEKIPEIVNITRRNKSSSTDILATIAPSTAKEEKHDGHFTTVDFSDKLSSTVVTHRKKSKEEIMKDILQIEAENEKNKKQRIDRLKKKFNTGFHNNKHSENTLTNAVVNL